MAEGGEGATQTKALTDAGLTQTKLALWFGHETGGLSAGILARVQGAVAPPCRGLLPRLPLSVQVAICLSEVARQRMHVCAAASAAAEAGCSWSGDRDANSSSMGDASVSVAPCGVGAVCARARVHG